MRPQAGKAGAHPTHKHPPAPPYCSNASTHLHPIIPKLTQHSKLAYSSVTQKQAGAGAQFMLPPAVIRKLKGGPRADHVLLEEMNGMFLGSATSYLPL